MPGIQVVLLLHEGRDFGLFPARVVIIPRRSREYLSVGPTLSAGAPVDARGW